MRDPLPMRRQTIHQKFRWQGYAIFVSCGYYRDGRLGEIFLSAGKLTSGLDIAAKDTAIAMSIALQHGCTVETLARAFLRKEDGDAEGLAGAALQFILKEGLDKIDPFEPTPNTPPPDNPPPEPLSDAVDPEKIPSVPQVMVEAVGSDLVGVLEVPVESVSMNIGKAARIAQARARGYEGESCVTCGNFTMTRNGTCLKCETCGSTSGCS